jgi:hypothetical protein
MEIAIGAPDEVREKLRAGGWRLQDGKDVTHDPWAYQRYLSRSRAEFSAAKHAYVMTQCGWFSDRSTGYLASGRPVVVEDTGFTRFLPTGEGLLAYRTRDEAINALEVVSGEYELHCKAARAVVEEFFDADRILTDLLEAAI